MIKVTISHTDFIAARSDYEIIFLIRRMLQDEGVPLAPWTNETPIKPSRGVLSWNEDYRDNTRSFIWNDE